MQRGTIQNDYLAQCLYGALLEGELSLKQWRIIDTRQAMHTICEMIPEIDGQYITWWKALEDQDAPRSLDAEYAPSVIARKVKEGAFALSVEPYEPIEKQKAFIVYGESIDADTLIYEYEFSSRLERDAFLQGVSESVGWLDYAAYYTRKDAQEYLNEAKG